MIGPKGLHLESFKPMLAFWPFYAIQYLYVPAPFKSQIYTQSQPTNQILQYELTITSLVTWSRLLRHLKLHSFEPTETFFVYAFSMLIQLSTGTHRGKKTMQGHNLGGLN